jgi:hypothetical protein
MYTLKTWHAQDSHLLFFHPSALWPSPSLDFSADLAGRNSRRWLQIEHLIQTAIMVKYNLLQPAIVGAAVLGFIAPAFGVPAQAGKNSIFIIPTLPSLLELNARSTLRKRDSFTQLGRMTATETFKVLLSTNTQTKTTIRKLKGRSQLEVCASPPKILRPSHVDLDRDSNWEACNIQSPRS